MATRINAAPPSYHGPRRSHSEQPSWVKIAAVAASVFVALASYNKWGFWKGTLVTLGCATLLYKLLQQEDSDDDGAPARNHNYPSHPASRHPHTAYYEQEGYQSPSAPRTQGTGTGWSPHEPQRTTALDGEGQQHVQPGSGRSRAPIPTNTEWSSLISSHRRYPPGPTCAAPQYPTSSSLFRPPAVRQTQGTTAPGATGQPHVVPGSRRRNEEEGSPTATGADGLARVVPGSRNRRDN